MCNQWPFCRLAPGQWPYPDPTEQPVIASVLTHHFYTSVISYTLSEHLVNSYPKNWKRAKFLLLLRKLLPVIWLGYSRLKKKNWHEFLSPFTFRSSFFNLSIIILPSSTPALPLNRYLPWFIRKAFSISPKLNCPFSEHFSYLFFKMTCFTYTQRQWKTVQTLLWPISTQNEGLS